VIDLIGMAVTTGYTNVLAAMGGPGDLVEESLENPPSHGVAQAVGG
jgi:hypothetical protein